MPPNWRLTSSSRLARRPRRTACCSPSPTKTLSSNLAVRAGRPPAGTRQWRLLRAPRSSRSSLRSSSRDCPCLCSKSLLVSFSSLRTSRVLLYPNCHPSIVALLYSRHAFSSPASCDGGSQSPLLSRAPLFEGQPNNQTNARAEQSPTCFDFCAASFSMQPIDARFCISTARRRGRGELSFAGLHRTGGGRALRRWAWVQC